MILDEKTIAALVERTIRSLQQETDSSLTYTHTQVQAPSSTDGIYTDIESGILSAKEGQMQLAALGLKKRGEIVNAIRQVATENVEQIATIAHEETGYGRIPDKIQKKLNTIRLTPGIEDLKTEAISGDDGLVLIERAPVGVIASIEPATHPGSCIINHAISMIAAGNSIVFLPHPKGIKTAHYMIPLFNKAIQDAGGPPNLLVVADKVSMEIFDYVIHHPAIDLIVATGGPAVVDQALRSGKKAIAAGPGNPPVIVDETVDDLEYAASCIVEGASFDNTVLCIAEKVIIAVNSIADELLLHLQNNGAYIVKNEEEKARLIKTILPEEHRFCPDLIGKDAALILSRAGITVPEDVRLAIVECLPEHDLVQLEQLLPVLPFVRAENFEVALGIAAQVEHEFRHTSIIHSRDIGRITRFAQTLKTDIIVANASSGAGLAVGGEGHYSHTIASPTGEGICTPKTYTREQRTVIVGSLRTVS
jgi:propionaldehyde dehydrogenase